MLPHSRSRMSVLLTFLERSFERRELSWVDNTHGKNTDTDSSRQSESCREESAKTMNLGPLSEKTHGQVRGIPAPFAEVWNGKLGEFNGTEYGIIFSECSMLFRSQTHRAVSQANRVEQESVGDMLKSDTIVPSRPERESRLLLIPKSNQSLRFCVDYRLLNGMMFATTMQFLG